jgi:hypothetical protein
MPKDPKKNVDRFKVKGGDINEYDYAEQQEQLTESKKPQQNPGNKAAKEPPRSTKGSITSSKKAG